MKFKKNMSDEWRKFYETSIGQKFGDEVGQLHYMVSEVFGPLVMFSASINYILNSPLTLSCDHDHDEIVCS